MDHFKINRKMVLFNFQFMGFLIPPIIRLMNTQNLCHIKSIFEQAIIDKTDSGENNESFRFSSCE